MQNLLKISKNRRKKAANLCGFTAFLPLQSGGYSVYYLFIRRYK